MSGMGWNGEPGGYNATELPLTSSYSHTKVPSGYSLNDSQSNYSSPYSSAAYDEAPPTPIDEHHVTNIITHRPMSTLSISHLDEPGSGYGSSSDLGPVASDHPFRLEYLEAELRRVSAELAFSIRREMELEDELSRSRDALDQAQTANEVNRGSDYYSDLDGARFPIGDVDARIEQLEKERRQAEQDRARTQLDLTQRLQDEIDTRRQAEERMSEAAARVEQLRRQLSGERAVKESFEGLMTEMRRELEQLRERLSVESDRAKGAEKQLQGASVSQDEVQALQKQVESCEEKATADAAIIANLQVLLSSTRDEYERKLIEAKDDGRATDDAATIFNLQQLLSTTRNEYEQKLIEARDDERATTDATTIFDLQNLLSTTRNEYEQKLAEVRAETAAAVASNSEDSALMSTLREEIAELRDSAPQTTKKSVGGVRNSVPTLPPAPGIPQESAFSGGLSRSMSVVTRRPPSSASRRQTGMLARSGSVRDQGGRSSPLSIVPIAGLGWATGPPSAVPGGNSERVQHVEEQRDALRATVQSLRQRLSQQTNQHAKEMRRVAQQMNEAVASAGLIAALDTSSGLSIKISSNSSCPPTLAASVARLRQEMQVLRRRADDLVDQKWRCEKGLGGLKMDLDRSLQDTVALHVILGRDTVTDAYADTDSDGERSLSELLTSDPILDDACNTLRSSLLLALGYLDSFSSNPEFSDFDPADLLAALKDCLYGTDASRRVALAEAQCLSPLLNRSQSIISTTPLSDSTVLAVQSVASRLAFILLEMESQSNATTDLLSRVAETANSGSNKHESSTQALAATEAQLRQLEDSVMAAQTQAEAVLATCEEDVRALTETNDFRVLRIDRTRLLPFGDDDVTAAHSSRAEAESHRRKLAISQTRMAKQIAATKQAAASTSNTDQALTHGALFTRRPLNSQSGHNTGDSGATSLSPFESISMSLMLRSKDLPSRRPWREMSLSRSIDDAAGVDQLTDSLDELEMTLQSADDQMSSVVGWMNRAQVNVEGLQMEREALSSRTEQLLATVATEKIQWRAQLSGAIDEVSDFA